MPYVSEAQQGYFHEHADEIGPGVVKKFDKASKGSHDLPEHAHRTEGHKKLIAGKHAEMTKGEHRTEGHKALLNRSAHKQAAADPDHDGD